MSGGAAVAARPHHDGASMLVRRSVRRVLGTPGNYMPGLVMPLLLIAINSQSLQRMASLPGFPADDYLDFVLVLGFVQAALVATTTAGLGLARDIETGFASRMSLTPLPPWALILAQVAGATSAAALSGLVYVAVGIIGGVSFASGPLGIVALLLLATWAAAACSLLGCWVALRSGGGETLQSITPILFAGMFLSNVNMPLHLIEATWFRIIATLNPVTRLVDGMRSLIISGWDPATLGVAALLLAAVTAVALHGCLQSMQGGTLERVPRAGKRKGPPKAAAPSADASPRSMPVDAGAPARGIAWRHLHKWRTVPSVFYPSFALPLIFFLGFAGPLGAVGELPTFDYPAGWVTWIYAFALVQSCMYGGVTSGFAIAIDFRTGFARRMMVSVDDHRSILLGFVFAAVVRGAFTSAVVTVVALAIGMRPQADPPHIAGALLMCWTMSVIATLWAAGVMLRARDPQRAPAMQIPVFMVIFMSPLFMPLDQLSGWLHAVASVNPISYLLGAARSLLVDSTDGLGLALIALAVALAALWIWAETGLRAARRAGA